MSGRKEMDEKKEKWITGKLRNCPQIIRDYMLSISENKTSATRKAYLGYLMQYIQYIDTLGIAIADVKPMHIDQYRNMIIGTGDHRNGASIVNAKLSAVISFYEFLKENGIVKSNPCDKKKKLKVEQKDTVVSMTDKEVMDLKYRISNRVYKWNNRDACIVQLGCSTGLRVSAIVNINLEDIDFEKKEIKVIEKGNKKRTILIGDKTLASINRWMADRSKILNGASNDALFISQKRNRLSVRAVEDMIKKETANMDKHITPHKMRSTCGMRLYEKKRDIYLVQQQLGHKSIRNTQIYAKASNAMMRDAANILD